MKLSENTEILNKLYALNYASALMYLATSQCHDIELNVLQIEKLNEQLTEVGEKLAKVNDNFIRLLGINPKTMQPYE